MAKKTKLLGASIKLDDKTKDAMNKFNAKIAVSKSLKKKGTPNNEPGGDDTRKNS
jgi:hypothetical protein